MGERFGMPVLHGYNGGIFLQLTCRQNRQTSEFIFGRVTVLRGSVLHGYNEGLFLWSVSRQICQTFENFLEGVSFLRVSATGI